MASVHTTLCSDHTQRIPIQNHPCGVLREGKRVYRHCNIGRVPVSGIGIPCRWTAHTHLLTIHYHLHHSFHYHFYQDQDWSRKSHWFVLTSSHFGIIPIPWSRYPRERVGTGDRMMGTFSSDPSSSASILFYGIFDRVLGRVWSVCLVLDGLPHHVWLIRDPSMFLP